MAKSKPPKKRGRFRAALLKRWAIAGVSAALVTQALGLAKSGPHPFDSKWIRDAHDVRAVIDGCYFCEESGQDVIDFFAQYLRHSKGRWAGQPFILEPWQDDATRCMFGWKRADGTRRHRKAYIEVPKKNGKSTWIAGLNLYMWVGDGELGPDVFCAAVDRNQAGIVFDEIANMVRQSPELVSAFNIEIVDSRRVMRQVDDEGRTVGKLETLSADVPSKEGLNIHAVSVDELHAHKSRAMWSTIQYGGAARLQPMMMMITTAGVYDIRTIGWQKHEEATRILEGKIEDWTFFVRIYAAGPKDDWKKESTWKKANPSYGVTIDPQTFAQECRSAQQSLDDQNEFKRYRLNMWTQQAVRAIDTDTWKSGAGHEVPLTRAQLRGRVCDLGLDLSSVNDLTAAAYTFPSCDDDEEALDVFVRCWVPDAQLRNEKNPNQKLYQQWADQGWLEVIPGRVIDYDVIVAAVIEDAALFQIRDINIDYLFQGHYVAKKLADEGWPEGERQFGMRQGFLSFGPAYKEFKRLYLSGKIHHGNHPIIAWSAGNVEVASDPAGNEKIVKGQGGNKVDPMVALVMATDRTRRHEGAEMGPESGPSDYETEGILVL